MSYTDEQIIALKWRERRKTCNCIKTGIYVGNELIQFKNMELFDNYISIMLPDKFDFMSEETAKYKYPSVFRPQIILCDETEQINMTFSKFDEKMVTWESLAHGLKDMQVALKNVNPSVLFFHNEIMSLQDSPVPWMDFKSYDLFTNMTVLENILLGPVKVQKRKTGMILGMFNCPFSYMKEWNYLFVKVIETIKEQSRGERG